jgi:hypothetical protein
VIPQLNRADKAQEFLMASVILPANPSESRPGRFGVYGGRYVPETLVAALDELEHAYEEAKADAAFQAELSSLLADYAGRPTPLYFAKRLTESLGGAKIYLKREDLLHTGAHIRVDDLFALRLVHRERSGRLHAADCLRGARPLTEQLDQLAVQLIDAESEFFDVHCIL